jgi:hypothetical protein
MSRSIDPVCIVLDRIAVEHPEPARFCGYEIEEWPEHAAETLIGVGLLVKTNRAKSAICTGCEAQCHKPVIVRRKPYAKEPNSFILCDEEADLGRIPVRLSRLDQYQVSLATAARFAASALKLGTLQLQNPSEQLALGWLRSRNGPREVVLSVQRAGVRLLVGEQEHDLIDLICWGEGTLSVDHALLLRLANRKGRQTKNGHARRQIEKSVSIDRTELLARRDEEILRRARRLKTGSKTLTEVSREIAAMSFLRSPQNGLRPITAARVRRIVTHARRR